MKSLKTFIVILAACIVLAGVRVSCAAEVAHARFISEFARFVLHEIAAEQEIRAKLAGLITDNKNAVAEGLGKHPELIQKMYELAGTGKLSCFSSRYYTVFQRDLTNEERETFYNTKRNMDRWVLMLAVVEAGRLGVSKPSSPLAIRVREDVPFIIGQAMTAAVRPYLNTKPGKEGETGAGFDDLPCD